MHLTPEGEAQLPSVLTLVYAIVGVLCRADEASARRVWRCVPLRAQCGALHVPKP